MISLKGKRALVTGGSRGVGAATAIMLAECGADVAIGYQSRRDDAEQVAKQVRACGVRGSAHAADIATAEGASLLFAAVIGELGGLDIFVGNAGIWPSEDVATADLTDARWSNTVRQNLDSVFYTTRLALQTIGRDGRVVLVSSTAGQRGEAYHSDYAVTKGAMISFVKSVAIEVAKSGTTVNCVAPGWIDTEMVDSVREGGSLARIAATIPIGRVASARDVAAPIVFLCSDQARHITGEVLNVNGGSVLCG